MEHPLDVALNAAIVASNTEQVKQLIAQGATFKDGNTTSFEKAIETENLELLELMLSNGVDFTHTRMFCDSPVQQAVKLGKVPVVDLLVRYGVPICGNGQQKITPLYSAVCNGNVPMVQYLVQSGVDINRESPLYSNYTPLHKAADMKHENSLAMVNVLLAANANLRKVNESKQSALHLASLSGRCDVVKRLVECGAPMDAVDRSGCTPLSLASCAGHADCVRILCVSGALLNLSNRQGLTPLHLAVVGRQVNATKVLLKFHASVNKASSAKEGRTPLLEFLATCKLRQTETSKGSTISVPARLRMNKEIEILDSLRYANASFDIVDKDGNSAVHLCVRYGTEDLLDYMINHRANTMLVNNVSHSALSFACSRDESGMVIKLIQLCPELLQHANNRLSSVGSPFVSLHRNQNFRCLRYLFEAGYRPNKNEMEHLISSANRKSAAIAKYIENEMGQPQSLIRLSRVTFRNQFPQDFKHSLYQITVPHQLREDLLLESPYLFYS